MDSKLAGSTKIGGSKDNAGPKYYRPGPCEIQYKNMKFLITDRPTDKNIDHYILELKKYNVKDIVRVCEASYTTENFQREDINVIDLEYPDGSPPPSEIVEEWFCLLKKRFKESPDSCVAVHCVAGLGRAPVLVALALMELGMKYEDAVQHIRSKRKGAINSKQLAYLEKYRPKSRLKIKTNRKSSCTAM